MQNYEKLGAFYLGRVVDPAANTTTDDLLLYDSKDLTTHAVCVGMTGSGKTGLCVSLLEEAGIDGIPAIAIDPKGDLSNLYLTFPELRPADFRPWIDPGEATRNGVSPDQYSTQVAKMWKRGLADWNQDGDRIARFREACELAIYTPGSHAGRPLRVLRSLAAPGSEVIEDNDALQERIQGSVSGLLSLLDIEADPVRSREHILLTNLIDRTWREGRDYELAGMIADIQSPPFDRLGVMDLESFFPAKDRFALAMSLNNLLASPGFSAWMEGEPLDIGRMLYRADGKPKISIMSIAHLSDRERMFFVTLLLNEIVSWVRAQPGTSSLRALLYMDEVFGYFPPTANPPSKQPMLTLLKQARAQGLGVMLATQNPVDLDYKGLSNMGTWFLGRLQTERDKARVLDGLEGAAASQSGHFDRSAMDRMLSGLGKRVFLMNNVHDDRPELFQTRWALSYLRGPLTRTQIRDLAAQGIEPEEVTKAASPALEIERQTGGEAGQQSKPILPEGIQELFLEQAILPSKGEHTVYRPRLLGTVQLHYANRSAVVDHWSTLHLTVPLQGEVDANIWGSAEVWHGQPVLAKAQNPDAAFAAIPAEAMRVKNYSQWEKKLKTALYRDYPLKLLHSAEFKAYSKPGQDEREFKAELRQLVREKRDLQVEKLHKRYAPKLARLQDRIRSAEEKVGREKDQSKQQKMQTAISLGATILGALFGRKTLSTSTLGKAATTMRGAGRIAREHGDVARATERLDELSGQLQAMQEEFEDARAGLGDELEPDHLQIDDFIVRPRKTDISIDRVALIWVPWNVSPEGIAEPGFEIS